MLIATELLKKNIMKTYKVKIADSEIEIKQDDDGLFIKPDIMLATSGIGSALKPAVEPITIARKPISEKTLVDNFVKWGVGGINIDQCRVGLIDGVDDSQLRTMNRSAKSEENGWGMNQKSGDNPQVVSPQGRFPANLILTYPENEYILKSDITLEQKKNALKWIYENAEHTMPNMPEATIPKTE